MNIDDWGRQMNETYTNMNQNTNTPIDDEAGDEAGIIPFADEVAEEVAESQQAPTAEAAAADVSEIVENDELIVRASVVDRDLGLDEAAVKSAQGRYACPCCGHGATRVMRVRVSEYQQGQPRWVALCAVCAASMLAKVPGTVVGGMVRPSKRRAKRTQARDRIRAQRGDAGFRQAS